MKKRLVKNLYLVSSFVKNDVIIALSCLNNAGLYSVHLELSCRFLENHAENQNADTTFESGDTT
ncbi:MAG: hypothetical protein Tsb009_13780 [Planctomycetaceae bacterium]